jgi:hypothetical protein
MTSLLEVLTILLALGLAWWLLRKILRPKAPADPAEDPFSLVPVPRDMGPKGRSGAVALDEPEEDNPPDAYPPREL